MTRLASTLSGCSLAFFFQVAVVDEIQMMGDPYRGASFTRAILGLPAREVHVCGDPAALPLIRLLAAEAGDSLHGLSSQAEYLRQLQCRHPLFPSSYLKVSSCPQNNLQMFSAEPRDYLPGQYSRLVSHLHAQRMLIFLLVEADSFGLVSKRDRLQETSWK